MTRSEPDGLSLEGLQNEEELKVRYLVPLLERLGIYRGDIRFEQSFSFKAGRQTLSENVSVALQDKRPRLDVLVTRAGRNLFVIEAKPPSANLTDEDRLQAISYARLVHPIAPYALVTNGRETRLYDTVSRQLINAPDVRLDHNFEIALPSSDDFDALGCFLRLSATNLLRFARAQTEQSMRALRGSPTDLAKKYVPELHQPRAVIAQAVRDFHGSGKSTLCFVADSGIGKTCSMCHQALDLLDAGQPVLFLRGSELDQRLIDRIAEEFAWTFSESTPPPALVARLSQIAGDGDLLIFLDGIDEWTDQSAHKQLGALARHLSGTKVKLVVSCKRSSWPAFLHQRGTPTDFASHVLEDGGQPGVAVGALEEQEFYEAMRRYKQIYGFSGLWDESLLEEAKRSPFFMRVAFEVAKGSGLRDLRETSLDLFERYYGGCLAKTANPEQSGRLLVATAKAMLEDNVNQVGMHRLRGQLELRLAEELPEDLFLSGVLERISGNSSGAVRFAFEGLRNYVIAIQAYEWHKQSADAFRDTSRGLKAEGVQAEVLLAYYKLASTEHKRVLDRACYEPAMRFLAAYKDIIATHFAAFASAFPPGDLENAGLVLEANLRTNEAFGHGLRRLRPGEPEVLILPTASWNWRSDALLRVGAGGLSYRLGQEWLRGVDPHQQLLRETFSRVIPSILRSGALNEQATPELARELLAAAVLSKPELLNEPNRGRGHESLPLLVSRIRYWLLLQQHWMRLEQELVESKIAAGVIPVERHGSSISYSPPPLSESERADLRRRCDDLIAVGQDLGPQRYVPFDRHIPTRAISRLKVAIAALMDHEAVIEGPLFPIATQLTDNPRPRAGLDRATVAAYARDFVSAFLRNYERLVSTNFPTLKSNFALHRELPVLAWVAIPAEADTEAWSRGDLMVKFLRPSTSHLQESRVEVVERSELTRSLDRNESVEIDGIAWRTVFEWRSSFGTLRASSHRYPDLGLPWFTVLRDYTYSWIENELDEVAVALGAHYGLDRFGFHQ